MEKMTVLRLNVMIAGVLIAALGACTKTEKRENAVGSQQQDTPNEPPVDSPCLRMKLVQDEEPDDDEGEGEEQEEETEEEKEEESKKSEDDESETEELDEESGVGSTSTSSGCDDEPSTASKDDPETPVKPSGSGSSYDVGPGIIGCEEKSQAWVAVKNGGSGVCEGSLVKWCCSESEITTRFPSVAAKLTPKFKTYTDAGYKLYHCSEKDGKTIFHFGNAKDMSPSYKTVFVGKTASKDGDTKGASCPVVTLEDMGFNKKVDTTETETKIPATIGEIEDTSKEGILVFLKSKDYQDWRGDSAFRTSEEHGKIKIFFNAKLEKSLEDDKGEHPVGSLSVKEIYKGSVLDGYAIMGKHKAGSGKDTWFFYEVKGGAPDFDEVTAYDIGAPSDCADCHKAGKDFLQGEMQPK